MIPGTRALAFAARWFDASTVANVFEPLIADWQREWRDTSGSPRLLVWLSGASALCIASLLATPRVLLSPWPPGTKWPIVRRVTLWTLAMSSVLSAPFAIVNQDRFQTTTLIWLLMRLLISNAALILPVAVATIVDVIRRTAQPSRQERIAALWSSLVAATTMLLLVGWGVPISNQVVRMTQSRVTVGQIPSVTRSMRDLSLSREGHHPGNMPSAKDLSIFELLRDRSLRPRLWPADQQSWRVAGAEVVLKELCSRFSLTLLPIALLWMRWRALLLPRGRWYSALPAMVSAPITIAVFYGLLAQASALADVFSAPRWSGPLLAVAVMIVGSLAIDQMRQAGLKASQAIYVSV